MTTSSDITIKGLHCADCVAKAEQGLLHVHGVISATLTFSTSKLRIEYDEVQLWQLNGYRLTQRKYHQKICAWKL